MNILKPKIFPIIILLLSAAGCSKENPDEEIKNLQNMLIRSENPGIYRNGNPVFLFDPEIHQLLDDPSQCLFRFQDDDGLLYIELRLNTMPAVGEKCNALIRQNMDLNLENPGEMFLIDTDEKYLRFWSNETRIGFVFPNIRP